METQSVVFNMNEENHFKAVPDIPTQCPSQSNKVLWSTVSKATLRSRGTRTEHIPGSAAIKKPLDTQWRADSLVWCLQNLVWTKHYCLLLFKVPAWAAFKETLKGDPHFFPIHSVWVSYANINNDGDVIAVSHKKKKIKKNNNPNYVFMLKYIEWKLLQLR